MAVTIKKATYKFYGGLKLKGHKQQSMQQAIAPVVIPEQLIIPLQQHIGKSAKATIAVGDKVLKGQCIARTDDINGVTAIVHAPTSGEVIAIEPHLLPATTKQTVDCIVIKPDNKEQWHQSIKAVENPLALQKEELKNIIHQAGIVGLGGAGFPTHIKMVQDKPIDTLIINAAECEPYITCDAVLIKEQADKIVQGIGFVLHALDIKKCIIGIEDNKPEAIQALATVLEDVNNIELVKIPTRYPAGGEKQLIKALTGKEIPTNKLPRDLGILCQNVATVYAVADAILEGKPLIKRVVTVSGDKLKQSGNRWVLIGTPMQDVLKSFDNEQDNNQQLIMGGPMMGIRLDSTNYPVIKTTNCLLLQNRFTKPAALPCIRCGECARVCPAKLLPQQLYWYSRAKDFDHLQDYQIFSCIECGCCDYVCPSHIPLVQFYRFAKNEIWQLEADKKKSDHARQRHEQRLLRLERKKKEDAERKAKKKALLQKKQNNPSTEQDAKKDAIQAALERVKSRQAEQAAVAKNTENLSEEQRKKINEVEQRRRNKYKQKKDNNE